MSTVPPTAPVAPGVRQTCHAHTSAVGLHHVGRGHWARNTFVTIVGAVRSVIR